MSRLLNATSRTLWLALLAALLMIFPATAMAAGSEANVVLEFTNQDKIYLYISLALGIIAIVTGFALRAGVLSQSPGDEKMQEVGGAIHQGAIAYLKRQVGTMIWFVLAIAAILVVIYSQTYGSMNLGILTAVSFILGVAASYVAGYIGMDVAVRGNMRTAHAALSSYAKSLQIAFRSGAVAGMMTVGLGLLGATIIFLVAGKDAMKLLVGFGFGGSLAALFMRVGGGIFTKAADVGADLVGKVEAGIPEDDPRNPATIADNVGDNVGDCAGMAADVFESYEVTLVAAIVLGAATSAIFDSSTWMKLILFALMARGVGIIASIIGIYMMKGSDDINSDPLKSIRKGFQVSAILAGLMTAGLAYYMMGGMGEKVQTSKPMSMNESLLEVAEDAQALRSKVARAEKKEATEVTAADLAKRSEIADMKLPKGREEEALNFLLNAPKDRLTGSFEGYRSVAVDKIVGITAARQDFATNKTTYKTVAEALKDVRAYALHRTQPANPAQGVPTAVDQVVYAVQSDKAELQRMIDQNNQQPGGGKVEFMEPKDGYKPAFYQNAAGDLAVAFPVDKATARFALQDSLPIQDQFYKMDRAKLEKINGDREKIQAEVTKLFEEAGKLKGEAQNKKNLEAQAKQSEMAKLASATPMQVSVGIVEQKPVEWWRFLLCILFGIIMAFAIEMLTDYYVSTHKKPVQEIAGVSNAGPAPMIIQGFALAAESSVFSVFSIVIALIAPMVIFPPDQFGGYILSFYGIALVGLGLLTTTGYILAMDTFGPISDNAQGVFEMSGAGHASPEGSKRVQRLDAAGNTTKALTKGFAIATAVVAAVALFHSFVEDAHLTQVGMRLEVPEIFLGLLIGGAAPYLFSAFSINAVGRSAFQLINEVRRQFREDPGIMAGTSKPNYGNCVAIVTAAAQKELLGPGVLAIALPVAVAFGFSIGKPMTMVNGVEYNLVGAQALGGFLAGCILSGQLMAVLLANSGGMWDNAKKLVEDGMYGGKGTDAHKAAVVCDTVGDPFKDTAGPALNPLIKVMNLVALLLAPVVIAPHSSTVQIGVTVVCIAALAFSVWWSKRGSMGSEMMAVTAEGPNAPIPAATSTPTPASEERGRITIDDEE